MTPDEIYRLIGQLLHEKPDFSGYEPLTTEQNMWIGRAQALVTEAGDLIDVSSVKVAAQCISGPTRHRNLQEIISILCAAFARAELQVSPEFQGAFIQAGSAYSAFEALAKVMREARTDILIVDPYLDEKVLSDYAVTVSEGCTLRMLAETGKVKPSLKPAVTRWQAQYSDTRPLEARVTVAPASLHDRLMILDNATVYTLTQSLNAFATRAPASIVRIDPQTADLKVVAYQSIWDNAGPL